MEKNPTSFSRPARLEDFFDDDVISQTNHNKHHSHNNNQNDIPKNQQEFGNRKRIKP